MHNHNGEADALVVAEKWQVFDRLPTSTQAWGLKVEERC